MWPASNSDTLSFSSASPCPLCGALAQPFYAAPEKLYGAHVRREYWQCPHCRYVFLDPSLRLSPDQEKARYLEHNNDPNDPKYRAFLAQVWEPLSKRLGCGSVGLDYGCGPGSPIRDMATHNGHRIVEYDPFFAPDKTALHRTYDFLVCAEAMEHFYVPYEELLRWQRLLRRRAWIGIMTRLLEDPQTFPDWPYRNDPTHVGFFQQATFQWIAQHFGWQLEIVSNQVILLECPESA